MKTKLRNQKGFTIIEVLIVLAIAGLILLIVFLAVPALQRNSRNTQRKSNVAAILGAVSEYSNNNNGALPAAACGTANPFNLSGGTCAAPTGTSAQFNQGYYQVAPAVAATPAAGAAALTTDTATLQVGGKCGAAGAVVGATGGASSRQVAVQFMNEGGGGLVPACQDS